MLLWVYLPQNGYFAYNCFDSKQGTRGILGICYLGHHQGVDEFCTSLTEPHQKERPQMHDLLIGLTFVGMVITPAIVAAFSGGTSETKPE